MICAKTLSDNGIDVFYTDGGCYNNGDSKGIGAWAFTQYDPHYTNKSLVYGQFINGSDNTNNRTEMLAVINAIKLYNQKSVNIISDSGYVVNGYNHPSYLDKWKINGWKTSKGDPVLNRSLWEELILLSYSNPFRLQLIRGHKKDKDPTHAYWNNIVDHACTLLMKDRTFPNNINIMEYDHYTQRLTIIGILEV